ncbi:hypothetical protein FCJ60_08310 [Burkholderia metallica]|nr:hypothetical protein [Burkholderia metallica]
MHGWDAAVCYGSCVLRNARLVLRQRCRDVRAGRAAARGPHAIRRAAQGGLDGHRKAIVKL